MKDLEVKRKVLDEIMGMMDEKDGERLKSHPKVLAAKVEVKKDNPMEMLKEKMNGDTSEEEIGNEESESPEMESSESEMTPEMIKKMLEMLEE